METIPLATYMWTRIHQVGVDSIMGVPGDFNLDFLDHIFFVDGLKWIGNSNELNAAYAADGYARTKDTPGCLVTTHGVGELSALNGIAGSASEYVPVIHVVGQTPMRAQDNHLMIHHSIGFQPDHQIYNKVSSHIRYSAAELATAADPAFEIDRVLKDCIVHRQPVYIFLPIDKTDMQVPKSQLSQPISRDPPADKAQEDAVIEEIFAALYRAKKPSVIVDYFTNRCGAVEAQALIDKLDLPFYGAHMGKGAFNEAHPRYVGMYNGAVTAPGIAKELESCDFVISIGWFPIDTNTSFFSRRIPDEIRIDIMPDHVDFHGKKYTNVFMAPLLSRLASDLDPSRITRYTTPQAGPVPPVGNESSTTITQSFIWDRLGKFIQPGDCVLADTGTATYGFPDVRFPKDVKYIAQSYWMSIGYTGPSAVGVDLALQELHEAGKRSERGRTVLCIGDGSLMLTLQEVGTMVLKKLPILIIILNNKGYTIERAIHGARQPYNDICHFDYSHLLPLFSPEGRSAEDAAKNYRCATTKEELEKVLADQRFVKPTEPQVLEVRMDAFDLPWKLAKALNMRVPGHLKKEGFVGGE